GADPLHGTMRSAPRYLVAIALCLSRTRMRLELGVEVGAHSKGVQSDAGSRIRGRKSRRGKSTRIVSARCLLAGRQLSLGGADLVARQGTAAGAIETRAY